MAAAKSRSDDAPAETGFSRSVDRMRENVKDFASTASETAADGIARLVDQGADGVKAMAQSVPDASHWADDQLASARDRVRAEPIKMMAIAAGVGALVGALFLR